MPERIPPEQATIQDELSAPATADASAQAAQSPGVMIAPTGAAGPTASQQAYGGGVNNLSAQRPPGIAGAMQGAVAGTVQGPAGPIVTSASVSAPGQAPAHQTVPAIGAPTQPPAVGATVAPSNVKVPLMG